MRLWGTRRRIPLCSVVGLPEVAPVVVLVQRDDEEIVLLFDLFHSGDLAQHDVEETVLLLYLFHSGDIAQQDVEEVVLLLVQGGVPVLQDVEEMVALVDQAGVRLLHRHAEEAYPPNGYLPSQCCSSSAVEVICHSYFLRIRIRQFDESFFLLPPSMTLFEIQESWHLALFGV